MGLYIYIFSNEKMVYSYIFKSEFKIMKKPSEISDGLFYNKERSNFKVFLQSILKTRSLVFYFNLTAVVPYLKPFF